MSLFKTIVNLNQNGTWHTFNSNHLICNALLSRSVRWPDKITKTTLAPIKMNCYCIFEAAR